MVILELTISGEQYDELLTIEAVCGFKDLRELNNYALLMLQWAVRKIAEGEKVGSKNKEGKFTELCMEFMDNIVPPGQDGLSSESGQQ